MKEYDFLNTNSSPYLGMILAIISIIPIILTYTIFKPKFKKIEIKKRKKSFYIRNSKKLNLPYIHHTLIDKLVH